MALTPYTSNDQVRAVLGVSAEELSDATLGLDLYGMVLKMELDAIGTPQNGGTLATAFNTVAAIAAAQRTDDQARLYNAVTMFSPFPVALQFETALPLLAAKQITDGKAAITRNAEAPFRDIIKSARDNYDRFRMYLTAAWAKYNATSAIAASVPTLFVASKPSTDRVKG